MEIKAVIIDDELPSIQAIESIISEFCPFVQIVGKSQSATNGIQQIIENEPDLVFLDIEMPLMNGFELLESIPNKDFHVIFITAYDQYAVQAFKVNAIDYLLKPINITDVINAVNRVKERLKNEDNQSENYKKLYEGLQDMNAKKIHLSTSDGVFCLNPDDIIRFSADGRYSRSFMKDGSVICFTKTLKELEEIVDSKVFFRVHKSHLINLGMVSKYNVTSAYQLEMEDGTVIDVARRKKDEFLNRI